MPVCQCSSTRPVLSTSGNSASGSSFAGARIQGTNFPRLVGVGKAWSFGGAPDGELPGSGLFNAGGKLYGSTQYGGDANNNGSVFVIMP